MKKDLRWLSEQQRHILRILEDYDYFYLADLVDYTDRNKYEALRNSVWNLARRGLCNVTNYRYEEDAGKKRLAVSRLGILDPRREGGKRYTGKE